MFTMDGFSIREYVGKMRSVEFGKCWPFDGGGVGRTLPPIEVRKFRWWMHELEIARRAERDDDGRVELQEEKDGVGSGLATVEDEKRGRGKQRTPKKRSVAELFAVAPPIEADGNGGEEEYDEEDGDEVRGKDVDRDELDEKPLEMLRKRKERAKEDPRTVKKTKRKWYKKKKKRLKVEICVARKEKTEKSKLRSAVNISRLVQDSAHIKQIEKVLKYNVESVKSQPSALKPLAKRGNLKPIRTAKLVPRNSKDLKKALPVCSILKNRTRGASIKKSNMKAVTNSSGLLKLCCGSRKHVSFSGKDVILGHNKGCSPVELPQLENLCRIFSGILAASTAMNNSSKSDPSATEKAEVVAASKEDIATSAAEQIIVPVLQESEKLNARGHAVSPHFSNFGNKNCSDMGKCSLIDSVDLNRTMQSFDPGNSTLSSGHSYSGDGAAQVSSQERSNSNAESQVLETLPEARISLPVPVRPSVSQIDAMSSISIPRNPCLQQPVSCLMMDTEEDLTESHSPVDPKISIYNCIPGSQHKGYAPSKDVMSSICFSAGSNVVGESRIAPNPASMCREKCIDDDFIGLPLNSQGELIHLPSDSRLGPTGLSKKQNTWLNSLQNFSSPQLFEPNYGMNHLQMKEKLPGISVYQNDKWPQGPYHSAKELVTLGSGFTGLQGYEKAGLHVHEPLKDKAQHFYHGAGTWRSSCHGCREDPIRNYVDKGKFHAEGIAETGLQPSMQPTMRLMGQNVIISKCSRECKSFDDGKVWTDKEIITERSTSRESDVAHLRKWPQQELFAHPSLRTKEIIEHQKEIPSGTFHLPPFNHNMSSDFHPQLMPSGGLPLAMAKLGHRMDTYSHPVGPQELLSNTSRTSVNYTSGIESSSRRVPFMGSHPQNACHNVPHSSTHCKHQSVSYSTSATSHASFVDLSHRDFAQPYFTHSSSNLPQWLLKETQQQKNQRSSYSFYPDPIHLHRPCGMPGNDIVPLPSTFCANIPIQIHGSNISQSCSLSNQASFVYPSLFSELAVHKSNAAVATCRKRINDRNGIKSKIEYFEHPDHASRTRKRQASKDGAFMKRTKKASLEVQEDSNALKGSLTGEQFLGHPQINSEASGFNACLNKLEDVSHVGLPLKKLGNDETRYTSGSNSPKSDGLTRSGPLKLSGGAKHILKLSQTTGKNKSVPVHATIPFTTGMSSGKLPVPQMKAAQIYQF